MERKSEDTAQWHIFDLGVLLSPNFYGRSRMMPGLQGKFPILEKKRLQKGMVSAGKQFHKQATRVSQLEHGL